MLGKRELRLGLLVALLVAGRADAATLRTLASFDGVYGAAPEAALTRLKDGTLAGTTQGGGPQARGTVFRLVPADPGHPQVRVVPIEEDATGRGASPAAELLQASDGTLFGTTSRGGDAGQGTIFQEQPPATGWRTVQVASLGGPVGAYPQGGLIEDRAGRLYGTTRAGGAHGLGTVLRVSPPDRPGRTWSVTVVHSFEGDDGVAPAAGLIMDGSRALYGTTSAGGRCGFGVAFRLEPARANNAPWRETVMHHFCGVDGAYPEGELLLGADGALYGTTLQGGAYGGGTVFRLSRAGRVQGGWTATVLQSLSAATGMRPYGRLQADSQGTLYATTSGGGACDWCGTVLALHASPGKQPWTLDVLFCFPSSGAQGLSPMAGLVRGRDGRLYGTTRAGGRRGLGTVFRLDMH